MYRPIRREQHISNAYLRCTCRRTAFKFVDNPTLIWCPEPPTRGIPANIRIHLTFSELRVIGLHFVADNMGLASFKFVQWAPKKHRFCKRVRFGRSRSFKVDDFGTNRKSICDFLLVFHCDYGPILHRFWDITSTYWLKIAYFSYPSLIRRPRSLWSLWNFAVKLTVRKLESWGYILSEYSMIVAWHDTGLWRTVGQMVRRNVS